MSYIMSLQFEHVLYYIFALCSCVQVDMIVFFFFLIFKVRISSILWLTKNSEGIQKSRRCDLVVSFRFLKIIESDLYKQKETF